MVCVGVCVYILFVSVSSKCAANLIAHLLLSVIGRVMRWYDIRVPLIGSREALLLRMALVVRVGSLERYDLRVDRCGDWNRHR